MRWPVIKKAMNVAREALGTDDVWVDLPPRLASSGEAPVYSTSDPSEPVASLTYEVVPSGGGSEVRMSLGSVASSVRMPRQRLVSMKTSAASVPAGTSLALRHGNNAAPLLSKVASGMSPGEFEEFARDNGVPPALTRKASRGTPSKIERKAKKFRPRRGSEVRVVAPDMEYGELGHVVGKPRRLHDKTLVYPVLVDGSSTVREYPLRWLRPNMVGRTPDE